MPQEAGDQAQGGDFSDDDALEKSLSMLTTPARYRIRVQGQLSPEWAACFGGFVLSWQEPGQTMLLGQTIDQAALHGILNTIRDLGLPLLEVLRLPPEESGTVDP